MNSKENIRLEQSLVESKEQNIEQYNTIRMHLKKPTVVISSAIGGDGKTKVAYNLAQSYANAGKSVLLVDANFRNQTLTKTFNVQNKLGLTELLANDLETDNYFKRILKLQNIAFLPTGKQIDNPTFLLESHGLKKIHQSITSEFSHVIYDTPALNSFSDAAIIGKLTDELILVVKENHTPEDELVQAKKRLEELNLQITGCIVNDYKKNFLERMEF